MTATASLFPDDLPGRSEAVLSPDGLYRYALRRAWAPGHLITWVMLNPSTADANLDDATVRAILRFSRDFGMGGLAVVNLYAWRSRHPRDLAAAHDPVGPGNAGAIIHWVREAHTVVAAWGFNRPPGVDDQIAFVRATATAAGRTLQCLGVTADGSPRHPLMLPKTSRPTPWLG